MGELLFLTRNKQIFTEFIENQSQRHRNQLRENWKWASGVAVVEWILRYIYYIRYSYISSLIPVYMTCAYYRISDRLLAYVIFTRFLSNHLARHFQVPVTILNHWSNISIAKSTQWSRGIRRVADEVGRRTWISRPGSYTATPPGPFHWWKWVPIGDGVVP